jgi:hypothetical protein
MKLKHLMITPQSPVPGRKMLNAGNEKYVLRKRMYPR